MKIDLQIVNAAGNTTAMVFTKLDPSQYSRVGAEILNSNEVSVEQVAFIVPPEVEGHGRIEMMGGEFCGNATRSYGYYLSSLDSQKPSKQLIEISGIDQPLEIEINVDEKTCYTKMPFPEIRGCVMRKGKVYNIVAYRGITHIILQEEPKDDDFVKKAIERVGAIYPSEAYGVMFWHENKLTPVVYVEKTNSLIWEGSCGSGSVALGVYLSRDKEEGECKYHFAQPGGEIEVIVTKEERKLKSVIMGGKIEIYPRITVDI